MFFASTARTRSSLRQPIGLWLFAVCALVLLVACMAPQGIHLQFWFPSSLHLATETFAIVVAGLIFAVTWHGYRHNQPIYLPALGCLFLAIGLLDFLHAASYKEMPDFLTPASPEKAINFWLVSRLLLAIGLLSIAFLPYRLGYTSSRRALTLGVTLAFVAVVGYLGLAFPERWPRTFLETGKLTSFKIGAELGVIGLFLLAALGFWRARRDARLIFDAQGLLFACLLSALADVCFARYTQVHGLYSLLGHLFKLLAYAYVYHVVFISCVRAPYDRLAVEMTERGAAERRIEKMAFHDELTELPNLALLRDRAGQALVSAQRDHSHVALLLIDIDQFKLINATLGHSQGDQLLSTLSQSLLEALPGSATLYRVGGDEFAVLLPGLQEAESTAVVLERIFDQLEKPQAIGDQSILSSASIGVAVAPADGEDIETLLRNAETAMYKAKEAGRKTWRYYDPTMYAATSERLQLSNGLRNALERGELVLHYQLQIDLISGDVIGAEALVRWQHPKLGMVSPARFIPVAEQSGLIIAIGAWILREACRQAAEWRARLIDIPVVAVNISAIQLQDPSLETTVLEALADAGLPPRALELELTESGLIQDSEQVRETIERLKAMGIGLAIDDFGTGYSCLAYLSRLKVDLLKIDQSFVRGIRHTADGAAIVAAIIQMARSLGLKTLAEGVEDRETAQALRELGCRLAQGYLFARPMPASSLTALMEAQRIPGVA
ncbi:putative bifunctional diguanylate cyclase/phosphodiesterase [Cupriavidus basilensis]|uniref:putative bifunctional diguanylate cyclase/phosphodiesterase n=1 Tax=Cupriavidus sp. TaxID=1873897 RepID=UPI003D0CBF28